MSDDSTLVEAIRRGERAGFAALVERYQRPLLALAFQFAGRREDAEDLVQETFIAAYRDLPSLRDAGKLRGWLAAMLRHLALRHRQRMRRRREEPLDDHAATLVSAAIPEEAAVYETLQRLSAPDREVLVLRYLHELSFREIGEVLGIATHAAEVRCARARARLWQAVRRTDEEEATRVLMRRTMGAVVAGGLSAAATARVMAAVTPLLGTPLPPVTPLLNPTTLQPLAGAAFKLAAGKALVAVGVAGVLVTGAVLLPRVLPKSPPTVPVVQPGTLSPARPAPVVAVVPKENPVPPIAPPKPVAAPTAARKPVATPPVRQAVALPPVTAFVPVKETSVSTPPAVPVQAGLTIIGPVTRLLPVAEVDHAEVAAMTVRLVEAARPQLAAVLRTRRGETLTLLDAAPRQPFMQELHLDRTALADPAHWPALAERTGAKYLLLGELVADGAYSFDARLVDLATHRDVAAASVMGTELPGQ